MKQRVIGKFQIMPKDINTNAHFYDAFDHYETETSASWIVSYMQALGTWVSFTAEEMQEFYTRPGHRPEGEEFLYNGLFRDHHIEFEDGRHFVTVDFISRCYKASPKKGAPNV